MGDARPTVGSEPAQGAPTRYGCVQPVVGGAVSTWSRAGSSIESVGTEDVEAYLSGIPRLERVVAAPEVEPQAHGGGRRIVTSVEIWSNGVVVRTADIA